MLSVVVPDKLQTMLQVLQVQGSIFFWAVAPPPHGVPKSSASGPVAHNSLNLVLVDAINQHRGGELRKLPHPMTKQAHMEGGGDSSPALRKLQTIGHWPNCLLDPKGPKPAWLKLPRRFQLKMTAGEKNQVPCFEAYVLAVSVDVGSLLLLRSGDAPTSEGREVHCLLGSLLSRDVR